MCPSSARKTASSTVNLLTMAAWSRVLVCSMAPMTEALLKGASTDRKKRKGVCSRCESKRSRSACCWQGRQWPSRKPAAAPPPVLNTRPRGSEVIRPLAACLAGTRAWLRAGTLPRRGSKALGSNRRIRNAPVRCGNHSGGDNGDAVRKRRLTSHTAGMPEEAPSFRDV